MSAPLTIAISGCGAVTSEYYVPVLTERRDRMRVVGIHDPDPDRLAPLAAHLPGVECAGTLDRLLDLGADLVVIASPPAVHADQAIAALRSGAHVLCEKPMALSLSDAEWMVHTARAEDRVLAVGMVRRWFPASRIVARMIESGYLGRVQSVRAFEGGPFRWPVRSQSYFSRAVSGGGVLADVGVHVLDLLHSWLGGPRLIRAADDAMGGVEANALLELTCGDVPASIRLSRDWERPNHVELRCERGRITWSAEDLSGIELTLPGENTPLRVADADGRPTGFVDCFGIQVDALLDHLGGGDSPIVTGQDALAVIGLIEQAYQERSRMPMPWMEPLQGGVQHGI